MTAHRFALAAAMAAVAASLLCAGCSRQPGSNVVASSGVPSIGPIEASMSASPSLERSSEVSPSADASIEPQPASSDAGPVIPEPPAASLAVDGGDLVVGELGSFSWQNSGSDAPWLPGNPIHVGAGEQLRLTLAKPVGIVNWQVSQQPPGASLDGLGAARVGEGSEGPVTFAAPPRGSWSISVDVWFADNLGSAAYYWLVTVD